MSLPSVLATTHACLLLILSDGKPTDIDSYERRYAIEDTRMSLIEARRAGLQPFCLTIDRMDIGSQVGRVSCE